VSYIREGKCVYMCRYAHAGIREMKLKMEQRDRHLDKAMSKSIGTMTYVHFEFENTERLACCS